MSGSFKILAAAYLVLALSACASTPPTATLAPAPYQRYIVERDLVVRQSANAGASEVGRLPAGSALTAWMEDVGGNWYRLHSAAGNVGYVFGRPFRMAD